MHQLIHRETRREFSFLCPIDKGEAYIFVIRKSEIPYKSRVRAWVYWASGVPLRRRTKKKRVDRPRTGLGTTPFPIDALSCCEQKTPNAIFSYRWSIICY